MCLLTRQKEPIILLEDKIVWKILKGDLKSPYQNFPYEFKTLYKESIEIGSEVTAFSQLQADIYRTYDWDAWELKNGVISINNGFHSFNDLKYANRICSQRLGWCEVVFPWDRSFCFECIIPKGSEYYEDETGLCVSNQIIINKMLK